MSGAPPDIALDARRWAAAREWTWEEAEYLLVGLDHWKIRRLSPDVPLDLKDIERARVREALDFHFRLEEVPRRVSPSLALEIASRAGITPPEELAEAVTEAIVLATPSTDTSTTPDDPKGLTRKYNKLLKVFLAVAVKRYGYNPRAQRQSAIAAIRQDAEAVGISVDDDTIRRRLSEAREELEASEEAGLLSRFDDD